MVLYGIEWSGVEWNGNVNGYGIDEQFGIWYGICLYGMVWYGMVWYGMVWYGMETLMDMVSNS